MRVARAIRVAPLQARQSAPSARRRAEQALRGTGAARDRRGAPPPARRFQRVPAAAEAKYRPSGWGGSARFRWLEYKARPRPFALALARWRRPRRLSPGRADGSRTDHDHQVVHGCDANESHKTMVTKRGIKIRNEARVWAAAKFMAWDKNERHRGVVKNRKTPVAG
jgi:hypothetical protein